MMRSFKGLDDSFIFHDIGFKSLVVVGFYDLWERVFGRGAGKQIDLISFNQTAPVGGEEITVVDYLPAIG